MPQQLPWLSCMARELHRSLPNATVGGRRRDGRAGYERTRPDDTFDDLRRRVAFDSQDAGLLRNWTRAAREAIRDMPPEEE